MKFSLLMGRTTRLVAIWLVLFGLCSQAHAGQWVLYKYEWTGTAHSENMSWGLYGNGEVEDNEPKYHNSIYKRDTVGRTDQALSKFDSPDTTLGSPTGAHVGWNNTSTYNEPPSEKSETTNPVSLNGSVSSSVTAVLHWEPDYIYYPESDEYVQDLMDKPTPLYVRETATASGSKYLGGNAGNAINERWTSEHPWLGEYFKISGDLGSFEDGSATTFFNAAGVQYGPYNKSKIIRIDNAGEVVRIPTYSFSGKVELNPGYEEEHADWQGGANISFGYRVDILDVNLNVSAPIVSRKVTGPGTQEIEALAGVRWMDPPVRQADGTWDRARAPFDSLASTFGLQFGEQDGLLPPLPYLEGAAGFEVAGPSVYNPQTYKWSPDNTTEPSISVGSDRQRSYVWNFGAVDSINSNLSKDTEVSVQMLPGEGAEKVDGETVEAKAKIHWSSIFSATETGIQKNTVSPPSFMFIGPNGGPIFTTSIKPGDTIKTFVKGDSGFAGQTGKGISIRPAPFGQDQTPGPGEHVEFREVTNVTPMGDGKIIVSFRTTPQINPDDDPNAPGYQETKLAGEVADRIEQTNQTGQLLVGTALDLYVEAARAVSIGRVEGWGIEGAIKGIVALGKAAEAAKAAKAGIVILEDSAKTARATVSGLRDLQRGGTLSDKMALQVEKDITRLEHLAAHNEEAARTARIGAQKNEEFAAIARAEIQRGGCFVAGTPVWMGDGTLKSIEQVKVGDQVLSRDEASGKVEAKRVSHTSIRAHILTLKLTFSDGSVLETTSEHPLYAEGRGFVKAGEVGIGTSIVTRAGPALRVAKVEKDVRSATVYNFTVEEFHTYFVGDSALWVHNVDCVDTYDEFYGEFGIYGTLDKDGIVEFAIEAGLQSPVRGTKMFENMLAKFDDKVSVIRGSWSYGDNLAELNKLTGEGMKLEDAAKLTWTGKRCRDNGFVNVIKEDAVGSPGNYTKVLVKFVK